MILMFLNISSMVNDTALVKAHKASGIIGDNNSNTSNFSQSICIFKEFKKEHHVKMRLFISLTLL